MKLQISNAELTVELSALRTLDTFTVPNSTSPDLWLLTADIKNDVATVVNLGSGNVYYFSLKTLVTPIPTILITN